MVGIYKVTNQINGKIYVGQSVDIEARFRRHKSGPFNEKDTSFHSHFYSAIRKYGLQNFVFEIVEECAQKDLDEREQYWIAHWDSYNPAKGYNETKGGAGSHGLRTKLTGQEVKEIQHLLKNTTLSQSDIGNKFGVSQRLISGINSGDSWHDDLIVYPIRVGRGGKGVKNHYYCIECGKEVSSATAQRCEECARKLSRVVNNRPNRTELKNLIRTLPFTVIAKQYGVSDNAIRKWCTTENLPHTKKEIKQYTDKEWAQL